ncbi:hypothetical protein [Nonomuraea phyllanthi]|uniref:hypothetical protein n=1 Tax=Nonomuraea phyllanthi TaxID=2219224 RepID=UPI001D017B68|nr:hypothetical protein [Nonomuraea phyllanthi]
MKTQLIGSWWVTEAGLRLEAALDRPADEVPRLAGVERDEVDRFAGPFDALFGVRVAMMPKVRRRHRGRRVGTPMIRPDPWKIRRNPPTGP